MLDILVTGSNGYIARNLVKLLPHYNYTLANRSNVDFLDRSDVDNIFRNKYYDVVIHTAVSGGSRLKNDDSECLINNLKIHSNLVRNQAKFDKFIHFGSGAELDRNTNIDENSNLLSSFPTDPYGMSKNIISRLELNNLKFYNLRIFNVFNEDELPTRMIKANIQNYIERKPIKIHQNKIMDFFYMEDLSILVKNILNDKNFPRFTNCSYEKHLSLFEIASLINNLDKYNVEIICENENMTNSYYGKYNIPKTISLLGFEEGLKRTYKYLKGL